MAQNCSAFYPFTEGATSELSLYDAKGKPQGKVVYQISNVSTKGSATIATMNHTLIDAKGKELTNKTYEATCKDGVVSLDFKSLMRPSMMEAYGDLGADVDAEVTGTNLDLPNKLSIGQELPDAAINVKLSMSGMSMNMGTNIVDRLVVGKETITTPAGTFECFVITQNTEMKTMSGTMKRSSKQWLAEGIGVVKSEEYDKNGKLDGSSVLSAFSK